MSLYIEDHSSAEITAEVKRQLVLVARPSETTQRHMFLPPVRVAEAQHPTLQGYDKPPLMPQYIPVKYLKAESPTDLGQLLVAKLANNPTRYIFIHGVAGSVTLKFATFEQETRGIDKFGGGFTTDVESKPHIDVFIDASPENTNYGIWTRECYQTPLGGFCHGFGSTKALPYVRLYHELLHANRMIEGLPHGEKTMVPLTNKFRSQRGVGYERATPWLD